MSKELLQKVIDEGVADNLNAFFCGVTNDYCPLEDDLSGYNRNGFTGFTILGELNFTPIERLVVVMANVAQDLTERSGKKAQYEIAKKILKHKEKYDAGIFVFSDPSGSFRFSLVYGQADGTRKIWSNFRRFSYYASPGLTNKTFLDRVGNCSFSSLEIIKDAFSVEKVNKEFYNQIARFFYRLTGYECKREMTLPSVSDDNKKTYQEFAVRLIGRTIFCWFLKHKKSVNGVSLIPEPILSSEAVKQNSQYYHSTLEKLFFEVLNTPQEQRRKNILPHADKIPFLNGGLFEPHDDFYHNGKPQYNMVITDDWFEQFFEILEQYNFTIDENSAVDADVSVDPEMLGRIFENLLAEVNPETGETARKATGSYYTPRIMVDYMVDQSLKQYMLAKTKIDEDRVTALLSYESTEVALNVNEKGLVISALDEIKIIDPACGSGAFPLGILHKMLLVLKKVDPDMKIWVDKRLEKLPDDVFKKEIKSKLERDNLEYVRKLLIIRNSIFGVDIQQIAVEISKLRVFLSLIVDETIDDEEENRGVKSLPNLEFKFVAANSLLGLPKPGPDRKALIDFEDNESIEALAKIRDNYFTSYGVDKLKAEKEFTIVQKNMFQFYLQNLNHEQRNLVGTIKKVENIDKTATQMLSEWEPFSNRQCGWFDSDWMFGVKGGFDVVIANPPYIFSREHLTERDKAVYKSNYSLTQFKINLYILFIEKSFKLLNNTGSLVFITPNNWLTLSTTSDLRYFLLTKTRDIHIVLNYAGVFENASVDTCILVFRKIGNSLISSHKWTELGVELIGAKHPDHYLKKSGHVLSDLENARNGNSSNICDKIDACSTLLSDIADVKNGVQAYTVGEGDPIQTKAMKINRVYHSNIQKNKTWIKYLDGIDVARYKVGWSGQFIKYGTNLTRPREPVLFLGDRLLVRQIPGQLPYCINACYIKEHVINDNNSMIIRMKNDKINIKYILGIINSKLISFWFAQTFGKLQRKIFPQFKVKELRSFPIKVDSAAQLPLVLKVDQILSITKDEDYLSNPTKQVKVKEQEHQIDQLVYQLYGLTPEEIAVVEGSLQGKKGN